MAKRKRNIQILFCVSPEEKKLIRRKMIESKTKNMGAYLRKMAIDGYIVNADTTPLKKQYEEMHKIGVNINQIAKKVNTTGDLYPEEMKELKEMVKELWRIRKREERKDRLHQNYLKRKASGAQKRYEDKIKGRKKAEIEAKKAAIRAEDIAKGVFVPVSSLPQREPMKGVQTA